MTTVPEDGRGAVLAVEGLERRFGATRALAGVDLTVAAGEILGVVGPSGCGKSTLLRLVAGLLAPDAGRIHLAGRCVAGPGVWVPAEQRHVGIVFQEQALFPHLTVAGNIAFGLRRGAAARRRVEEMLGLVDLPRHGDRYPHELSGGEQQRVALARALAPAPAVILLDEPFSDLDRNLRLQVRAQTLAILREAAATAILVTHDREEALAVGDRVAVMRAGRLEQVGVPEAVFHAPASRFVATFLGEADFLPGRRRNGVIETEVGPAPAPPGVGEGRDVDVMVRPHEVAFVVDPDGQATVTDLEFQGAFILYGLRLASGRRLRALQPHTTTLEPGQRVRVELTHGHPAAAFAGEAAVGSAGNAAGR